MAIFGKKSDQSFPEDRTPPARSSPVKGEPPPPSAPLGKVKAYGIDDAMALIRGLPIDDNVDLVMRVIKQTLESAKVRVTNIIQEASERQASIQDRILRLNGEVTNLEKEIATRREEITRLDGDLAETTRVKERLQLAERPETKSRIESVPSASTPNREASQAAADSPRPTPESMKRPGGP